MPSSSISDDGDSNNTPETTRPNSAEVDPILLNRYVIALDEGYDAYERFFNALLIKRADHSEFYHDLRGFRAQKHIVTLFTPPVDEKPDYRNITNQYLESRFAHPWCRNALLKQGWTKAEWGNTRRGSIIQTKEEDKLHRLLVPLWIRFRDHMNPSEEFLQRFVEWEEETAKDLEMQRQREVEELRLQTKLMDSGSSEPGSMKQATISNDRARKSEISSAIPKHKVESMDWDDEEDDDLPNDRSLEQQQPMNDESGPATAIARLFVGMATAGVILENKRARKYLLKKWGKTPK